MLTIRRVHEVSLTGVACLGAIGIMSGSPFLLSAGAGLIGVILYFVRHLYVRVHPRPKVISVHVLTVAGLLLAIILFRTSRIDSVLFVLMLGVFNRYVLRAGRRDDFFVLVSSSILFAAATTVTPGFEFAVLLFVFVPSLLMAMWMSTIIGIAEESRDEHAYQTVLKLPRPRGLRKLAAAGLVFTGFGFSAVSILPRFTFLPMLGAGAFVQFGGVPDSMNLTTGGVSGSSDTQVVIRVEHLSEDEQDQLPGLYARMYSLDEFDGKSWSNQVRGVFRHPSPPMDTQNAVQGVRVIVKRPRAGVAAAVPQIGRRHAAKVLNRQVFETLNGSWTASAGKEIEFDISVDLGKEATKASIPRGYLESQRDRLLSVPDSLDVRVRQLAQQLTQGKDSELEKVRAVLAHFDSGFTYSLDPLEGEHKDPLVRFLFEAKKGHCELYAGAVAILLRLSGVQARIASGYYGGHYNEIGNYLGFTGGDAHAWVEAYIPDAGWRWFDATPEDLRQRSNERDFATVISDIYDTLNRLWYDNVIDYESEHNVVSVAIRAAKFAREWSKDDNKSAAFFANESEQKTRGFILVPFLLVGAFCGLIYVFLQRRRQQLGVIGRRLRRSLGGNEGNNETLEVLLLTVPASVKPLAAEIISEYQSVRFCRPLPKVEFRARRRQLANQVDKLAKAIENA